MSERDPNRHASASKVARVRLDVRRQLGAAALLVGAAMALGGSMAGAQTRGVPSQLVGSWIVEGDPARAMRTVEAAFSPRLTTVPELLRGMARDRIRSSMQPPHRVLVSLDASRVRVVLESDRTTQIDGTLGTVARTSGTDAGTRVTPRLASGWLELDYDSGTDGEMRQLFSTEPDAAHMHIDITVTSAHLSAPVRYRLEYVRAPR